MSTDRFSWRTELLHIPQMGDTAQDNSKCTRCFASSPKRSYAALRSGRSKCSLNVQPDQPAKAGRLGLPQRVRLSEGIGPAAHSFFESLHHGCGVVPRVPLDGRTHLNDRHRCKTKIRPPDRGCPSHGGSAISSLDAKFATPALDAPLRRSAPASACSEPTRRNAEPFRQQCLHSSSPASTTSRPRLAGLARCRLPPPFQMR